VVQIQGYSPEALSSVTYEITNVLGLETNLQSPVVGQTFSTNSMEFLTNWFQAFDVHLANGTNRITVKATDLAGNGASTNLEMIWDCSQVTNPPSLSLYWPLDGSRITGATFTWRGKVADQNVVVIAQTVDATDTTNSLSARVARNGEFWIEGVPVSEGTNAYGVLATDAAGSPMSHSSKARSDSQ
jgi:hypothetical protein